jgi:hypothetical protein
MRYTAYRSEGGLLPADILEQMLDPSRPDQRAKAFGLPSQAELEAELNRAWTEARSAWNSLQLSLHRVVGSDTGATREQWLRPLLRVLGPVIIVSTAGIFGSGIMLAVTGPSGMQPWLTVHRAAFIIWFGAMTIHVLSYAPRLPRLLSAEARGRVLSEDGYAARAAAVLGGRGVRLALLIGSVVLGLIIAMLTVHLAAPWQRLFGTP